MSKHDELVMLFEENQEAVSTLDFAKYVREVLPRDAIMIPLDEAMDIYGDALARHKTLPNSPLSSMMINTLLNSMRFCEERREKSLAGLAASTLGFDPFISSLMHEIYDLLDLKIPHKLPKYFKLDAPEEHEHRFICYWVWSTVPLEKLHSANVGTLLELTRSYLRGDEAQQQQRSFGHLSNNNKLQGLLRLGDLIKQKKEEQAKNVADEVDVKISKDDPIVEEASVLTADSTELVFQRRLMLEQEPDVQLSLFAARKFLQKYDDALRRGISFSLTIDDIQSLLRRKVCHFTKERLLVNIGENHIRDGIIPDNYLTIDRLNPNRGYEPDNVVVCGHRINQLKAKLTEEQFNQVMSMHSLMNGMDEKQKQALQTMMGV